MAHSGTPITALVTGPTSSPLLQNSCWEILGLDRNARQELLNTPLPVPGVTWLAGGNGYTLDGTRVSRYSIIIFI